MVQGEESIKNESYNFRKKKCNLFRLTPVSTWLSSNTYEFMHEIKCIRGYGLKSIT